MRGVKKSKKKNILPMHKRDKGTGLPPTPSFDTLKVFPISPYMLLLSLLFWTCVIYAGFKGFQYLGVYRSIDNSDLEGDCKVAISKNPAENDEIMRKYRMGDAGPYIKRIGSQKFSDTFQGEEAPAELAIVPPVAMALQSQDFFQAQGLIQHIHKGNAKNLGLQLIIFDIGLYAKELKLVCFNLKVVSKV